MSIFDIFRSAPNNQQQQQPPATSAADSNPTVPNNNTPIPDGTQPGMPKPPTNNDPASPLAGFADLWQTPDTANNNSASPFPVFTADPQKLMEVAKKMDFARIIPKDKAELAMKGDAQAFGEVINAVTQAAFAQSTQAATHLINAGLKQQHEKLVAEVLPAAVREHTVRDQVRADNPIFSNPATAPLLDGLESQLRVKYPQATAAEISKYAKDYVTQFADVVRGGPAAPASNNAGNRSAATEPDWEQILLGKP